MQNLNLQFKYWTKSSSDVTFTIVLLCLMKVWKPNQRSFMHNSNATMTNASSSRVAWTCRWAGQNHCKLRAGPGVFCIYSAFHSRRRPGAARARREPRTATASWAAGPSAAPSCRTGGCGQTGTPQALWGFAGEWRTCRCSRPPEHVVQTANQSICDRRWIPTDSPNALRKVRMWFDRISESFICTWKSEIHA